MSASVVGSGHRETQPWSQALRGMLAPPVRGGSLSGPPDLHVLCPPRRGCCGQPWACLPPLDLGHGLCTPSCSVTHDGDTEARLLGSAAPESCPTSAWISSDSGSRVMPGVRTCGHPPCWLLPPLCRGPPGRVQQMPDGHPLLTSRSTGLTPASCPGHAPGRPCPPGVHQRLWASPLSLSGVGALLFSFWKERPRTVLPYPLAEFAAEPCADI